MVVTRLSLSPERPSAPWQPRERGMVVTLPMVVSAAVTAAVTAPSGTPRVTTLCNHIRRVTTFRLPFPIWQVRVRRAEIARDVRSYARSAVREIEIEPRYMHANYIRPYLLIHILIWFAPLCFVTDACAATRSRR